MPKITIKPKPIKADSVAGSTPMPTSRNNNNKSSGAVKADGRSISFPVPVKIKKA